MRTVFLDAVGLLALWDEADQWHKDAAASMEGIPAKAKGSHGGLAASLRH